MVGLVLEMVFLGLDLVGSAGGLVVNLLGASGSSCMGGDGACMFQSDRSGSIWF